MSELFNLFHLARTALAGTSPSKYDQMIWATKEFHKLHPEISATAAYKDLDGARGDWFGRNPKSRGKRSKAGPGPLTKAYRFGTGIVPGLLEGADSALGTVVNPRDKRLLKGKWEFIDVTQLSDADLKSLHSTLELMALRAYPSSPLQLSMRQKVAEMADEMGRRGIVRYRPNPTPEVESAYRAAMLADESFHRAVEQEWGKKRAGDMRYRSKEFTPQIKALAKRKHEADEAYRVAVARMRHGNPSQQRFLAAPFHGYPESEYERITELGTSNFSGTAQRILRGVAVTVLRKAGKRSMVRADYYGTPLYGWVDSADVVTASKFRKMYDYDPGLYPLNKSGNPGSDTGPVILCSNEAGNQLYFRGGDQALDLASIKMADLKKDHMTIGELWAVAYSTKKDFDDLQEVEYIHVMGPERNIPKLGKRADLWEDALPPEKSFGTGELPVLLYDTLNQSLSIAGGAYKIEQPLLSTSPGIEG